MTDVRDSRLEAQIDSVFDCLGEYDSASFCEHLEATVAAGFLVVFDAFEVLVIDNDVARDLLWLLALEPDDLSYDHFPVGGDGLILNFLDHFFVRLSASNENLRLHEFDEPLNPTMVI